MEMQCDSGNANRPTKLPLGGILYLKISKLFKTFGKAVPGVELNNNNNNNNNNNSINQKVL